MNIKAVAKKAGVSVATVSRVLNHPESVANPTKEHILEVMNSLDYTPNWFARGLKLNKTNVIALMVPEILDQGYMEIAKGVEDVAKQKKHSILLCSTEEDRAKELENIENFILRKIDGLIIVSSVLNKKDLSQFKKTKMPIVFIGRNKEQKGLNVVYTNYKEATTEAINHLIEVGHKNIGMVYGSRPKSENMEKLEGYKSAILAAKLKMVEGNIVEEENTIDGGYLAVSKILSQKDKPDAIFASSDNMAIGAMEKIKQLGLKIPEDIAVIGFDNLKISGYLEPKLTTVAKPMYRMGLIAARLLFDIMEENNGENEPQEILIQSKIKVRKSCGHKDRLSEIF